MAGTSLQHKDNKKLYCPKILKPKMQKPSKKPKKTIFQRSWNRGPPQRVCKYCFFCFFWFFQCFFGFSLRGPPQRVCKYCFFLLFLIFLFFPMFFWFFFKGSYLICFFVVIVLPFPSNDPSLTVWEYGFMNMSIHKKQYVNI